MYFPKVVYRNRLCELSVNSLWLFRFRRPSYGCLYRTQRSSIDCHKWNGMRASSNKPLRITAWPSERHVSSQRCIQWRTLHCWNKRIWSDQLNSLSHLQFGSLDAQRRKKKWSFVVFAHFCVPTRWNHLSWKTLARSNPTEWGWEAMV